MISFDDRDLSAALAKRPGPLCRPAAPRRPAAAKSPEGPVLDANPAVPYNQIGASCGAQSTKRVSLGWGFSWRLSFVCVLQAVI